MFIGHFGVALAAKKAAPRTSLGTLVFAAQFLDLLWPILLLLGIEHVEIAPGITRLSPFNFTDYPYSHSLLMVAVWAALAGGIYYVVCRDKTAAWIVAACVLSHWVLDLVVHRPDLPLAPGGSVRVGFGLWNSLPAAITAEVLFFFGGVWIYLRATRARDNAGRYGLWSLLALWFFGWVSTLFSGAPPNVTSLAWGGMTMWITVPWAGWADRHREAS